MNNGKSMENNDFSMKELCSFMRIYADFMALTRFAWEKSVGGALK